MSSYYNSPMSDLQGTGSSMQGDEYPKFDVKPSPRPDAWKMSNTAIASVALIIAVIALALFLDKDNDPDETCYNSLTSEKLFKCRYAVRDFILE